MSGIIRVKKTLGILWQVMSLILGGEPGGQEVFYCECETLVHCHIIVRALNSYHAADFERNRRGSE